MALPPVEVVFRPSGHQQVLTAIRSIASATQAAAKSNALAMRAEEQALNHRAAAYIKFAGQHAKAVKVDQEAWFARAKAARHAVDFEVRDLDRLSRARQNVARATGLNTGGGGRYGTGGAGGGGGGSRADIGGATLNMDAFRSAISIAADALKSLGGFILNDIIKPQMDVGLRMTQLANSVEGADPEKMRAQLNAWSGAFAHLDPKTIEKTFASVMYETKDFSKAQEITGLALKASQAYGLDAEKTAAILTDKRDTLSGMSSKDFEVFANALLAKTRTVGEKHFDEFAKVSNDLETVASMFAGESVSEKAANTLAVTGLIAAASSGTEKSAKGNVAGLNQLLADLKQKMPDKVTVKSGQLVRPENAIAGIMASVGGDLNKLGGKFGSTGNLSDWQVGKMSPNSIKFLRNIGLEKTFREAEQAKAGTGEEAVRQKLISIMTAEGDARRLEADDAKVRQTGAYKAEEAMARIKAAFYKLVPVVESKLVPALEAAIPQIEKVIADVVDGISGADIGGILKGVGVALAAFGYYALDLVDTFKPGGLSDSMKKAKGTLGKAAGVGIATPGEAEAALHPEKRAAAMAALEAKDEGIGGVAGFFLDPFVGKMKTPGMADAAVGQAMQGMDALKASFQDEPNTKATVDNTKALNANAAAINALIDMGGAESRLSPILSRVSWFN